MVEAFDFTILAVFGDFGLDFAMVVEVAEVFDKLRG